MSPLSRRLLVYWLLLLVPTLIAGAGGVLLLRREQARLVEQEAYAGDARRAAIATRTGLIVENVELLVGDVQAGLLETLAAMSADGLNEELALWEKRNPLVRAAFLSTVEGRVLYPAAGATDEESRAFRRRLTSLLEADLPWRTAGRAEENQPAVATGAPVQREEGEARQRASGNVAQVQNARRDAQTLSKSKDYLAKASPIASSSLRDQAGKAEAAPAAARQGWVPWNAEGRLHLLGWVEVAGTGEIRGVEIELAALVARLGGALPAETGSGEGYALRDERGRILHQAGWAPRDDSSALTRLPLSRGALPGWDVVAFLDRSGPGRTRGNSWLAAGSLLAGLLLVAILAGGSLLVWQARLSEAEAVQKTSFVANVSHEFKTPLTTIRLYAELLEQGRVPAEGKRDEYLRTISRETQRLARLVGNALEFSRLEQGRKKFLREELEAGGEIARLLDTHEPRLAEAGLKLVRQLPAAPVLVRTDRDALEQIVLNLLDNAAKYAAAGSEVTVAVSPREGGGAVVRVLDRGPGVPAEHRELIFEKFHRVNDALTAGQSGTGLGLSIARQLARGLGGDLRHEPRDGGGAAFVLDLNPS